MYVGLKTSVLALAMLSGSAISAETAYDFTVCTHSQRTVLEASQEAVALGIEAWGIVASSTTKEFERARQRCVGYVRVLQGKLVGKGVCKWTLATGETALGEFEYPDGEPPKWTWLSGTGRLKGIQGGGTFQELFSGQSKDASSSEACRHDWGKYSLP